jgi:hypothetical protein
VSWEPDQVSQFVFKSTDWQEVSKSRCIEQRVLSQAIADYRQIDKAIKVIRVIGASANDGTTKTLGVLDDSDDFFMYTNAGSLVYGVMKLPDQMKKALPMEYTFTLKKQAFGITWKFWRKKEQGKGNCTRELFKI